MDCAEARDHLSDLNRGRLPASTADAVRAHVEACAACAEALDVDAEVRARVRREAPRYTAPPALRERIRARLADSALAQAAPTRSGGWRTWLPGLRWTVGSLAGATAAVLLLGVGWLWMAKDPVSVLLDRAVDEHAEYVKDTMTRPAADSAAVMRELQGKVEYAFEPVFPGDAQQQLVVGTVSDLPGARAATFVYRDGSGRYTTLLLLPEASVDIPAEGRLPIEAFTPYHRVVSGRQLLLWKQGRLAYLLVSDLDQAGSVSMFLKIRKATCPSSSRRSLSWGSTSRLQGPSGSRSPNPSSSARTP
jgi:anti-sigma factor (TIGR02949 family)